MTKEQLQKIKAENEELKRKSEDMSAEPLKLEAVKRSLVELLKPEICQIAESYKSDVESMVSEAIDDDHAHEYEASLGYDA